MVSYKEAWNDGYTSGLANARDHLGISDEDLGDLWEEATPPDEDDLDQDLFDNGYQEGYETGYSDALFAIVRSIFNLNKIDLSSAITDWKKQQNRWLKKQRGEEEDE
jgi:hypothetical protein